MWNSKKGTKGDRGGRRALKFFAIIGTLVAMVIALGGWTFANPSTGSSNPPGNNGTIKIHEQGTPSGTESNDPKVCVFNVEGFGFDAEQTGYLVFTVQGGDGPTGTNAGPYAFGPTDSNGYYATQYFNLDNGHYKATLYGKDANGHIDYTDVKAKSKVFKVKCAAPAPHNPKLALTVTGCVGGEGTALVSGTVTDRTEGVDYSATISPDAAPFPTPVEADGTFSLVAQTDGLHTVTVTGSDDSSVSASVDIPGCTPPPVDVCPNIPGNQSEIPPGMHKDSQGNCVTNTPPPPTDAKCPAGTTGSDMNHNGKIDKGECVPNTPPVVVTDVCKNPGVQSVVPAGMHKNSAGYCVKNVVHGPKVVTDYVSTADQNKVLVGLFGLMILAGTGGALRLVASRRR